MTFAEKLRQLRREKDMTLAEVAEAIGTTSATISRYESGIIKSVPPEKVHQLANLFGVTRPYMMGWTDDRHANPDENLNMVTERILRTAQKQPERDRYLWLPVNTSDCITAATQALRALVKFKIARFPVYPQQIIQASDYATMLTMEFDKNEWKGNAPMCMTAQYTMAGGIKQYIFHVDRNAPIGKLGLYLATELGHIYLGHTEYKKAEIEEQEARCFAIHLRFPRPVIRLLEERGFIFTDESFQQLFGFGEWCMDTILNAPRVEVSPELNRLVKEQFTPYVDKLDRMGILRQISVDRRGDELDLSQYMAGYEE